MVHSISAQVMIMAGSSRVGEVVFESISEEPHQPKAINFPKRSFGKKNPVFRSFQQEWFTKFPFLHYDEAKDIVFCHICLMAVKKKRMKTGILIIDQIFVLKWNRFFLRYLPYNLHLL